MVRVSIDGAPRALLIVLLACVTLLPACRRRARTQAAAARPMRGQAQLLRQAEADLRCHSLTLTAIDPRVVQVVGCGQVRDFVGDGRRSHWVALRSVEAQAVAEMACSSEDTVVTAPSARMRTATGCARVARYDLVCEEDSCEWRMTAHAGAWAGTRPPRGPDATDAWSVPAAPLTTDTTPYESSTSWTVPGGEVELAIPEPPPSPDPVDVVTRVIDGASAALHSCAPGPLTVHAAWSIDGVVTFSLPPSLAGTAWEACLHQYLEAPRVLAATPGGFDYTVP